MPWKVTDMINRRTQFVLRSLELGTNFAALCQEYGISRRVGYKWKARFLSEGANGMADQPKTPQAHPKEIGQEAHCRIARLRENHPNWGPKKIHALYHKIHAHAPSLSTIKRLYERSGWTKKRPSRARPTPNARLNSGRKALAPNDIWSVDFKGWWHTNDLGRCEPLTVRDEHTRYLLSIITLKDAKTETVQAVFEQLFLQYGLPKAIRSDNGSPFAAKSLVLGLSRLSAWWTALGIDLERSRPGCPQDNGAHERLHKDISAEIQTHRADTLKEQQAALDLWQHSFNHERPHEALSMQTPAQLYSKSQRPYTLTPITHHFHPITPPPQSKPKRGALPPNPQDLPLKSLPAGSPQESGQGRNAPNPPSKHNANRSGCIPAEPYPLDVPSHPTTQISTTQPLSI